MKNIDEFLRNEVDNTHAPSVQYAFFDTGSVVYEFHYGVSNVKAKTQVTAHSTYNLFSVTKTFTALAIFQLAQEGKIQIDKPVADYLPGFPYSKEITISQLLNHTSGIPNPLPLRWIHLAEEHSAFNRNLFFKEIFQKHPGIKSPPGSKFSYSNLGYVILGQLIEKISGMQYETYVREKIIIPSGAGDASLGFYIHPETHVTGYQKYWSATNVILGFLLDKKKYMGAREASWKPFHNFYINGISYGGMTGSRQGLVKYAQALLGNNSVLLDNPYKQMLFSENYINGKPTGMSNSWFIGMLKGNKYFAHAGGGGGYYTELRIYPALGRGSVIMFNRSGMTDERILDKADEFFIN
jgi:CubicO group peptidase (beta-lactamase class C family)